jgi:hypothetical protein
VEEPLTSPRHKACAVGIDDFIVITGGTMLGLGKHKPSWLAEIGTRFDSILQFCVFTRVPKIEDLKNLSVVIFSSLQN